MRKYAIIQNGKVQSFFESDEPPVFFPDIFGNTPIGIDITDLTNPPDIGWLYLNGVFIRIIRFAMIQDGIVIGFAEQPDTADVPYNFVEIGDKNVISGSQYIDGEFIPPEPDYIPVPVKDPTTAIMGKIESLEQQFTSTKQSMDKLLPILALSTVKTMGYEVEFTPEQQILVNQLTGYEIFKDVDTNSIGTEDDVK